MTAPLRKDKPALYIFLDIDGVIADFDLHAHNHDKFDDKGTPKWLELDAQWWKTMPVFDGAKEFYDDLQDLARVRVLTAPVPLTDSFTGKAEWLVSFQPERGRFALLDLINCRSRDKNLFARKTSVLVDDNAQSIKEWEEAGGIGVLHTGDFAKTLADVKEAVEKIKRQPAPRPKPPTPPGSAAKPKPPQP